jgi:hypothetical protein
MVILDPDLDFLPSPDPGYRVKKAPDPGLATMLARKRLCDY